jgi:hypothetical protein
MPIREADDHGWGSYAQHKGNICETVEKSVCQMYIAGVIQSL